MSACAALRRLDPFAERFGISLDVLAFQQLVAACLPDDELRVVRQHVALKARQHLGGQLAADAFVDHGYRELRPTMPQLFGEQSGIGVRRIGGAHSHCRGRTDRDYDQGLARAHRAGGVGQLHPEARQLLRRAATQSPVRGSSGRREKQERDAGGCRPSRHTHRSLPGCSRAFSAGMPRVTKSAIARPMQSYSFAASSRSLLTLSGPQIQRAALGPIAHDVMAAEQRHVVGIRQFSHRGEIGLEMDHSVARA